MRMAPRSLTASGSAAGLLPDQWSTTAWKAFMVQFGCAIAGVPERESDVHQVRICIHTEDPQ